jgi:hypothetical protein
MEYKTHEVQLTERQACYLLRLINEDVDTAFFDRALLKDTDHMEHCFHRATLRETLMGLPQ